MKSLIPVLALFVVVTASSCDGGTYSCDCVTTVTSPYGTDTYETGDVFETSKKSKAEEKCNEFKEQMNSSMNYLQGSSASTTCELNKSVKKSPL